LKTHVTTAKTAVQELTNTLIVALCVSQNSNC